MQGNVDSLFIFESENITVSICLEDISELPSKILATHIDLSKVSDVVINLVSKDQSKTQESE